MSVGNALLLNYGSLSNMLLRHARQYMHATPKLSYFKDNMPY